MKKIMRLQFVLIFILLALSCVCSLKSIYETVIYLRFCDGDIFVGARDNIEISNATYHDTEHVRMIFKSRMCVKDGFIPICLNEEITYAEKANECYFHFNDLEYVNIDEFKKHIECCVHSALNNIAVVCDDVDKKIVDQDIKECWMNEKDPFYVNA
ncbi:hypothetical protein COBT_003584 [Conglomerata obtusa]